MSRRTVGESLVKVALIGTAKWTKPFLSNRTDGQTVHNCAPAFCGALTKVKYFNTNSHAKYQVNVSKDSRKIQKTNFELSVLNSFKIRNRRTDRQTPDKVIPICRYASQATQK